MNKEELLEQLELLIENSMVVDSDEETEIIKSNLRVFFDICSMGESTNLKKVLVENFCQYYGHTMADENPIDVLTVIHLKSNIKMRLAKESANFSHNHNHIN